MFNTLLILINKETANIQLLLIKNILLITFLFPMCSFSYFPSTRKILYGECPPPLWGLGGKRYYRGIIGNYGVLKKTAAQTIV